MIPIIGAKRMTEEPHAWLKRELDPAGVKLNELGANHLIVGYLPDRAALHVSCNGDPNEMASWCEAMAHALNSYAADLRRTQILGPKLTLPSGAKLAQGKRN